MWAVFISLATIVLICAPALSVGAQDALEDFKGYWVGRWNNGRYGGDVFLDLKDEQGKPVAEFTLDTDRTINVYYGVFRWRHRKMILQGDTLVMKSQGIVITLERPKGKEMTGTWEALAGQFKGDRGTYLFRRKE